MDKNESTPQPQLFVSKRVEKWALQFAEDGSNWINVHQFMCVQCPINVPTFYVQIETLEGTMTAKRGDWIVKCPRGEFYPVKPDIFALSYELRSVAGGEPEQPEELGDPLWPHYQEYMSMVPPKGEPRLTYSGWLRRLSERLRREKNTPASSVPAPPQEKEQK